MANGGLTAAAGGTDLFDLVIVGASFAGLVAARTAAMRGLKVAVIEAKPDAGARVHTTGILVKEAAEEIDIPHDLTRRIHGVRLYAPNLRHTDLFAPGYFFLTTQTAQLLRWLSREALRAGARLYFGCRFEGAERDGDLIRIGSLGVATRYLIGADGGKSRVSQAFGLSPNTRFLVGVEAEYETLSGTDPRFLHCFIDARLAPGYLAWVAPGPTVTQVGLATHGRARPDLHAFRKRTEHLFGYTGEAVVERRAGRIPCGGLVRNWAAPGVMLIGDAAGQVSPLTGGGIRLAFHYGRRAAHAVADHLLDLGPPPEQRLKPDLPKFGLKTMLRRGYELSASQGLPGNAFYNLVLSTPLAHRVAQYVYFHKRGAGHMSFAQFELEMQARKPEADTLRFVRH